MKSTALLGFVAACGTASAGTVQLAAFTNNSGISNQIDTSVTISSTANTVTFSLSNNTTTGRVDIFYIELGTALSGVDASSASINNSDPGVNFAAGGSPPDPQGGINPSWGTNFFSMSATAPMPQNNGLSLGESLSVTFTHDGTFSLAAFMDALGDGSIRMAQHYLGFGPDSDSEWLGTTVIVPLPSAAWAGLALIAGIGGMRAAKRRHR